MLFKRIIAFIVIIAMLHVQIIGYSSLGVGYAFARPLSNSDGGDGGSSGGTDGGSGGSRSDSGGNDMGTESDSSSDSEPDSSSTDDGKSGTTDGSNDNVDEGSSNPTDASDQDDDFGVDPQSESTHWSEGGGGKDDNEVSFDSSSDNSSSNSESPQRAIDNAEVEFYGTYEGEASIGDYVPFKQDGIDYIGKVAKISHNYTHEKSGQKFGTFYHLTNQTPIGDRDVVTSDEITKNDISGKKIGDEINYERDGNFYFGTIDTVSYNYKEHREHYTTRNVQIFPIVTSDEIFGNAKTPSTQSNAGNGALTKEAANIYSNSNSSGDEPSTDIEPGIFASHSPVYTVDEFRERVNSEFPMIKDMADSTVGPNSIDARNTLNNSLADANTNHNQTAKAILDILPQVNPNNINQPSQKPSTEQSTNKKNTFPASTELARTQSYLDYATSIVTNEGMPALDLAQETLNRAANLARMGDLLGAKNRSDATVSLIDAAVAKSLTKFNTSSNDNQTRASAYPISLDLFDAANTLDDNGQTKKADKARSTAINILNFSRSIARVATTEAINGLFYGAVAGSITGTGPGIFYGAIGGAVSGGLWGVVKGLGTIASGLSADDVGGIVDYSQILSAGVFPLGFSNILGMLGGLKGDSGPLPNPEPVTPLPEDPPGSCPINPVLSTPIDLFVRGGPEIRSSTSPR